MDHKPSILQDLELGRPMEIDGMFDAPLALAHLAGVEVPTLELLVAVQTARPSQAVRLKPACAAGQVTLDQRRNPGAEAAAANKGDRHHGNTHIRPHGPATFDPRLRLRRGRRPDGARLAGRSGPAIGLALDAGINYFDTAVQYGNGASETQSRPRPGARRSRQASPSAPRCASRQRTSARSRRP